MLEVVAPAAGNGVFIGGGITKTAALPAQRRPLRPDRTIDQVGAGRRSPIKAAAAGEVVVPADSIRCLGLIGDGQPVVRGITGRPVFRENLTMYFVGAGRRRPVNGVYCRSRGWLLTGSRL